MTARLADQSTTEPGPRGALWAALALATYHHQPSFLMGSGSWSYRPARISSRDRAFHFVFEISRASGGSRSRRIFLERNLDLDMCSVARGGCASVPRARRPSCSSWPPHAALPKYAFHDSGTVRRSNVLCTTGSQVGFRGWEISGIFASCGVRSPFLLLQS